MPKPWSQILPSLNFGAPILIFVLEQGETFQLGISEQWRE